MSKRSHFKIFLAAASAGSSFLYWGAQAPSVNLPASASHERAKPLDEQPLAYSLEIAAANTESGQRTPASANAPVFAPAAPADSATIETLIDSFELTPEETKFSQAFAQDTLSQQLKRSVLAWRYSGRLGDATQLGEDYVAAFRGSPIEVARIAEQALESMPRREFADERARLISLLADVADESGTRLIASREMVSGSAESSLVLTAASVFFRTHPDEATALSKTLEGIARQQDPSVQAQLAQQFASSFPALRGQLRSELATRGIEL